MKSQPFPPARPSLSLREKYGAARADLAKWSMLAAAPLRGETSARGLSPEASLFAKKVARGYAAEVDLYEKALMKQNGNRLPQELEGKLAQISKLAASHRDKQPLGLEHPEQSTSATVEGERFRTFAAMLAARGEEARAAGIPTAAKPQKPPETTTNIPENIPSEGGKIIEGTGRLSYFRGFLCTMRAAKWMTRARAAAAALVMRERR
jgi:hypothetical protein